MIKLKKFKDFINESDDTSNIGKLLDFDLETIDVLYGLSKKYKKSYDWEEEYTKCKIGDAIIVSLEKGYGIKVLNGYEIIASNLYGLRRYLDELLSQNN